MKKVNTRSLGNLSVEDDPSRFEKKLQIKPHRKPFDVKYRCTQSVSSMGQGIQEHSSGPFLGQRPRQTPLGTIKASQVVVPNEDSVVVTKRKLM